MLRKAHELRENDFALMDKKGRLPGEAGYSKPCKKKDSGHCAPHQSSSHEDDSMGLSESYKDSSLSAVDPPAVEGTAQQGTRTAPEFYPNMFVSTKNTERYRSSVAESVRNATPNSAPFLQPTHTASSLLNYRSPPTRAPAHVVTGAPRGGQSSTATTAAPPRKEASPVQPLRYSVMSLKSPASVFSASGNSGQDNSAKDDGGGKAMGLLKRLLSFKRSASSQIHLPDAREDKVFYDHEAGKHVFSDVQ